MQSCQAHYFLFLESCQPQITGSGIGPLSRETEEKNAKTFVRGEGTPSEGTGASDRGRKELGGVGWSGVWSGG